MSKQRSVIFTFIGVVLGALLTALLFVSIQRCESAPETPPETKEVSTDTPPTQSESRKFDIPDWELLSPNRDMVGNCNICGQILSTESVPLEGATVRLRLLDEPWESANVEDTVLTDENGKYCFNKLTDKATYQLFAWNEKYAVASYEDAVCGAATDLYLGMGASLILKFVDEKGYSVPYVEAHIAGSTLWPSRRALSDERGRLKVHGLTEGMYSFGAVKDELSFSLLEPIAIAPGDEIELEAQLTKIPPIRVTVKDGNNKAVVKGAVVTATPQNESLLSHTYFTDNSGSATIATTSVAGTALTIFASGFSQKKVENIHPGANIEVFLSRGSIIRGTVQTPKGKPVEGAILNARVVQGESFAAIANGNDRTFILKKADTEQKGWPQAIELEEDSCILGPTHIPLPELLDAAPLTNSNQAQIGWRPTATNGEFTLDAVPAGEISLGATHPQYVVFRRPTVNVIPGQNYDGIPILMKLGASVSLRVVSALGHPVSEAAVTVYDMDGQILKNATTGSDGYTQIEGLPDQFRVEAIAPLFIPGAKKMFGPSGETINAVIKLDDADQTLRGRVVNRLGTGIAGVSIEAELLDKGLTQVLTGESDSGGSFALENAGDGMYLVRARIDGDVRATANNVSSRGHINLVVERDQPESYGITTVAPPSLPAKPSAASSASSSNGMPSLSPPSSYGGDYVGGDSLGVHKNSRGSVAVTTPSTHPSTSTGTSQPTNLNTGFVTGSSSTSYGQADDLVVTGAPAGIGVVPITLRNKNKRLIVTGVQPGSLVAAAGLKPGATLLKINSKKVSGVAMANNELRGPIGSVVMIDFMQNGEPLSVVVQRERK